MTPREVLAVRFPDEEVLEDGITGLDANEVDMESGFLLIEFGKDGHSVWMSLHATPGDASNYHDNQEGADWWAECRLIDLVAGTEYVPVYTSSWVPACA